MPGKHAPASPNSFYVSLGKAVGGALGAVGLIVLAIVLVAGRGGGTKQTGSPAIQTPTPSPSHTSSPRPTSTTTPRPLPTPSILPKSQTIVDVLNGTNRNGLARSTGKKVTDAGYRLGRTTNAPQRYAKSTIFYLPGRRAEALAFQDAFPDFTILKQARFSGGATLQAVLGADYP